jgi:hypothetical protein
LGESFLLAGTAQKCPEQPCHSSFQRCLGGWEASNAQRGLAQFRNLRGINAQFDPNELKGTDRLNPVAQDRIYVDKVNKM